MFHNNIFLGANAPAVQLNTYSKYSSLMRAGCLLIKVPKTKLKTQNLVVTKNSKRDNSYYTDKDKVVSITYEEIGLFPRSFSRVLDRFLKQLFSDVDNLVIQEYRFYRYLFLTTIKTIFILLFFPFLVNFAAKNYIVKPITEYFWNTSHPEIFLNSYEQKRAFAELENFEEKIYFETLVESHLLEKTSSDLPLNKNLSGSVLSTKMKSNEFITINKIKETNADVDSSIRIKTKIQQQDNPQLESLQAVDIMSPPGKVVFQQQTLSSVDTINTLNKEVWALRSTEKLKETSGIPISNSADTNTLFEDGVREEVNKFSLKKKPATTHIKEGQHPAGAAIEPSNFNLDCAQVINQLENPPNLVIDSKGVDARIDFQKINLAPLEGAVLGRPAPILKKVRAAESCPETQNIQRPNRYNNLAINAPRSGAQIDFLGAAKFKDRPTAVSKMYQEKTIELATYYNNHSIEAITNFFADLLSLCSLLYLLITLSIQINITKSFLLEVFFGLDDSKKSLLILLITDLLVGYHSSNLWELFFEFIFNHYGIPESQTGIFLLVATLPVLLDVLFKYLIFRHLNRSSPATVATYQAIIE